MTDLSQQIEAHFPEHRKNHRPIIKLEAELARVKQSIKDLWAEYSMRTNRIRIKAAAIERSIRVEELYLKQYIAADLRAGREPRGNWRTRNQSNHTTTTTTDKEHTTNEAGHTP